MHQLYHLPLHRKENMANDTLPLRNGSNGTSTNTGNGNGNGNGNSTIPTFTVKAGLAQMLKGGVIMDVVNAEQVNHPS